MNVRDVVLKIAWVAIAIAGWIIYAIKVFPLLKEGVLPMWALVYAIGVLVLLVIYSVVVIVRLTKDYLGKKR